MKTVIIQYAQKVMIDFSSIPVTQDYNFALCHAVR